MRGKVLVSLLVSGVLGDEVKVFSTDDEGAVHLGRNDCTSQDTATDGDETGKRALLVCGLKISLPSSIHLRAQSCPRRLRSHHQVVVFPINIPSLRRISYFSHRIILHTNVVSLNGSLWSSESQSNILVPSSSSFSDSAGLRLGL